MKAAPCPKSTLSKLSQSPALRAWMLPFEDREYGSGENTLFII